MMEAAFVQSITLLKEENPSLALFSQLHFLKNPDQSSRIFYLFFPIMCSEPTPMSCDTW